MNNEPVAWMSNGKEFYVQKNYCPDFIPLYTHPIKEQDGCGNCHACLVGVTEHGLPVTFQRMIICPDCGNKRCPKASNHRHQCTESNEPNQRGSIYTHPVKELGNPVAWRSKDRDGYWCIYQSPVKGAEPLYTGFKELTDEEIYQTWVEAKNTALNTRGSDFVEVIFARAILRKASEK